jgi:hypothetical protein
MILVETHGRASDRASPHLYRDASDQKGAMRLKCILHPILSLCALLSKPLAGEYGLDV